MCLVLQVSVNRRHLVIFTAVVALLVSVAWVSVASRVSAASSTPVVYVATGENFPDALGAGPAAAIVKGPILLVTQNAIPGETAAELSRLAPEKIIIVGGTAVVSASVESGLGAYSGTVERIAGANRYDTAAKLSAATYPATMDADTLNGLSSSAFLARTGTAADSDKLDGQDSTVFLPNGTPPVGTTARGNYAIISDSPRATDNLNWGFELPSGPTEHFLPFGAPPTSDCPGTSTDPQAAEGHLCVYEHSAQFADSQYVFSGGTGAGKADAFGASVIASNMGTGEFHSFGTWAVTAGAP